MSSPSAWSSRLPYIVNTSVPQLQRDAPDVSKPPWLDEHDIPTESHDVLDQPVDGVVEGRD